ncbi:MAG: chemotaxis protein CheW [Cytophagales bacterium]|nr:chemotaxis protein CheW [Cytophagales bacterium]
MALGNNLRKKKVLPEQQAEGKPKKEVKKKSAAAKKATSKKQTTATKKAKPAAMAKPATKSATKPKKQVEVTAASIKKPLISTEISQEEHARRQALQQRYDEEIEARKDQRLQLIVFKFNEQRYAVEIGKSREVVKTPAISSLPHVPDFVPGLVNIRGFVIVTIDLAHKFFSGSESTNSREYTLVVEHGSNKLGVLLSDVPDTVIVPGAAMESSSGILADFTRDDTYIKGLVRTEQGMIFMLDIEELIEGNKVRVLPAKNSA